MFLGCLENVVIRTLYIIKQFRRVLLTCLVHHNLNDWLYVNI
jgi:hypothetical protein